MADGLERRPDSNLAVKTSLASQLSRGIVGLMHRYTGRGPVRARTTLNTNVVAVVLQETLTRGELNLVQAGQREAVISMRRTYHDAMRDEAAALVEEITSRTVLSVLADIDVDQDVAVIFFVLDPRPETGVAVTAETAGAPEE